jgi:hypothetical protein
MSINVSLKNKTLHGPGVSKCTHKKYTPCQQRFVPHVYCGPFLCGWQLSTSWQIPIVAASASWPVIDETKEADHVIFSHSFEYSQSQSSIQEKIKKSKIVNKAIHEGVCGRDFLRILQVAKKCVFPYA